MPEFTVEVTGIYEEPAVYNVEAADTHEAEVLATQKYFSAHPGSDGAVRSTKVVHAGTAV